MNKLKFFAAVLFMVSSLGLTSAYASEDHVVKTDHPRDTLRTFLTAMNDYKTGIQENKPDLKERIHEAVQTLNLNDVPYLLREEKGKEAAILIKEIIDRSFVVDYKLVPEDTSLQTWRLPKLSLRISKAESGERSGEFLFSTSSVEMAPRIYEKIKDKPYLAGSGKGAAYVEPWQDKLIPDWSRNLFLGLFYWQWIGAFIFLFLGFVIKKITEVIIQLFDKLTQKTKTLWDDKLLYAISHPVGALSAIGIWFLSIYILRFEGIILEVLTFILQIVLSAVLIWLSYRLVGVVTEFFRAKASQSNLPLDDQIVAIFNRTLKVFVVAFGILISIQNFGINVASLLAGLGLGGLAFALAAKDTAANLFGSIMLLIDRPLKIGDWVKIGSTEGIVEEIGLRSTRIRTFYKSVVSIPNSVLANEEIDNMSRRPYRRTRAILGLTYQTSVDDMKSFIRGVEEILTNHKQTIKDYVSVGFNGYGDSALEIVVQFGLDVPDYLSELKERQQIYLDIFTLAEKLGVDFAYPTQTLHVETLPKIA